MPAEPPLRPKGDVINALDPTSIAAWAAWLDVDAQTLIRLVGIVGSSAGQVEYVFGKSDRSKW